ncbi:sensor histidine kinase [Georgenia faecalis]|uniref:histidine kinase n=1 Tax=Georgenia faecalis TaxID=2483799 RepID=A0ABV9D6K6_9MICO|nr:sensor histidine kinase [Georgenia faecalis]
MSRTEATEGVDQRLLDALFGVGVGLAVALVIAADLDETGRAGVGAYLFAVGFGVLVLFRRRAPRVVLALTVLALFVYYALDFPPVGIALPVAAAFFSAAEAGRTLWAIRVAIFLVAVSVFALVEEGRPADYLFSYELLTNAALVAAAIALGVSVRSRREAREHQEQLHRVQVAEQERRAEQRVHEERMRIARDLHDVVGHTLSVIAVHGNVAAEAVGQDDDAARRAVQQIRDVTSATMRELRATVKVLRSPGVEPERGAVGLSGVPQLAEAGREAGIDVDVDLDIPAGSLDGAVDAAAYRIVQESLTNVMRHSGATRAHVRAAVVDGLLEVTVTDDGHGPAGDVRPGAGLTGMQERAAVLGGRVTFGGSGDGGFTVRAVLPGRMEP